MKLYVVPDEKETRFGKFKREAREKAHDALEWVKDNKETVLFLAPVAVSGLKLATTGVKAVGRHFNLQKQEAVKNLYCYDPSLGHYWALKRELKNAEWVAIDRRRKNGERLSEILEEMRVLK